MNLRRTVLSLFAALPMFLVPALLAGQTAPTQVSQAYGRSHVVVETAWAQPGGAFGVTVQNGRWATATTMLDGRHGLLSNETGVLFGLVPIALDAQPGPHKLSLYFPGGRRSGGVSTMNVAVAVSGRPGRARTLSPEERVSATSRVALGHGRFLLGAIRSHDPLAYQLRPLRAPVSGLISFPFGGVEDFGVIMGPSKDGLMGEQHRGVDYAVPVGTKVSAPGSGVVLLARYLLFSGGTVVIDHGRGLISVLSHLSEFSVTEEAFVSQGGVVGVSGDTGLGALSPHVCFSVYLHSVNVDPEAFMDPALWTPAR